MSKLPELIAELEKYPHYSFESLKEQGMSGFPTLEDLMPNKVIDMCFNKNPMLSHEIPLKANQFGELNSLFTTMQRNSIDLLMPGSGKPSELKIDVLNQKANIENQEVTKKWIVTIDAETIYSFFHQKTRGVDPNPPPETSTPIEWECNVVTTILTIKNTYVYKQFLSLKKRFDDLLQKNGTDLVVFDQFYKEKYYPDYLTKEELISYEKSMNLAHELSEYLSTVGGLQYDSDLVLHFKIDHKRRNEIEDQMIAIAEPVLLASCGLLAEYLNIAEKINFDFVNITEFPIEIDEVEGGGSIKA